MCYVSTQFFIANLPAPHLDDGGDDQIEVASGNGQINEHGHPIDDEDSDDDDHDSDHDNQGSNNHDQGTDDHDQNTNNHDQDDSNINDGDVSVGEVGIINDGIDDDNSIGVDETAAQTKSDESQGESQGESQNGNQDDSKQSDDSVSAGVIVTIVLSCLLILAAILVVLGFVCLSYKRRRPTFVVTHEYPKILVASDTHSPTTSIPKSYVQSPRFSPKGYEALPVTDYVPVQPNIKKLVY